MDGRKGTGVQLNEMVASAEERQRDTERAAQILDEAEEDLGVVVQDIPLDAIEPDPSQPRRVFDEEKLQSLAVSIGKYGLLQEPGVVAIATDAAGLPTRFRIIWGERRLRACRIAGLRQLRCKVLPRGDDTAAEQLRTKEKQWAENAEREGLSPVEEAISIQDAVDVARKVNPETPVGELVEKVGAQRGFNGMVARTSFRS
jgi:ParB family transcriptional regulator, chromosome partitioning protein